MKIGIALSGGGYRAATFHIGILARLAKEGLLEHFSFISTVSGGTIAIGLVYQNNGFQWPTSDKYVDDFVPSAYRTLTTADLQRKVILDVIKWPFRLFTSRANLISKRLRDEMGININVNQLPVGNPGAEDLSQREPTWLINSTCYETGANFRFESRRMGDYKIGYVDSPAVPLSDAIAASAGLPVVVGPLALTTNAFIWHGGTIKGNPPANWKMPDKLHLWDGGVYDNLGLEPLINYGGPTASYAYRRDVDYLIVSNASGKSDFQEYKPGINALNRLISIPKYQVESLRSRDMLHRIVHHKAAGRYFDTDNTCAQVLKNGYNEEQLQNICKNYLGKTKTDEAARIGTDIKNLTHEQFILLFRQGFEVADCTLHAFEKDTYQLLGFDESEWLSKFNFGG